MNFDYGEKKNYIITYKEFSGKEHLVEGTALSKSDAEKQFRRNFNPNCEIIKTQTAEEWIEEESRDIVKGLEKHIKIGIKRIVNKSKKINYSSKSFLKGLKKVKEKVEESREMSTPNYEKKYLSYNI